MQDLKLFLIIVNFGKDLSVGRTVTGNVRYILEAGITLGKFLVNYFKIEILVHLELMSSFKHLI